MPYPRQMTPLDPITLSPRQLEDLGPHDIHQFALRAVNTLTRYRLLLGRCLLAMHRNQSYLQFGCSSAIHYATSTLGLRADTARQLRRLAFCLESLPLLTQHAQDGSLSWAKLREVARVATPDSEAFWIEVCQNYNYREVERRVAHAQDSKNRSHQSELRIRASADTMALLERAMQSLSQEAGRILSPGEALEYLAAEYLSRRPLDTAALEAARHRAQQDQLSQQRQTEALAELAERSARNIAPWNALPAAQIASHGELHLVQKDKPHWNNPRARHARSGRMARLIPRLARQPGRFPPRPRPGQASTAHRLNLFPMGTASRNFSFKSSVKPLQRNGRPAKFGCQPKHLTAPVPCIFRRDYGAWGETLPGGFDNVPGGCPIPSSAGWA